VNEARAWYRIHFSTLVSASLVAATLALIQATPSYSWRPYNTVVDEYGWPCRCVWRTHAIFSGDPSVIHWMVDSYGRLVADVFFNVGILLLFTFCFELASRSGVIKRHWFQVHLSTCVILMIVSGILLSLTVSRLQHPYVELDDTSYRYDAGWPIYSMASTRSVVVGTGWTAGWNAAINLGILAACATASEWLLRRRSVRPRPA
jgi:hypothetical protein